MQTFKEFFGDGGAHPDEAPRGMTPELSPRMARMKSKQLMDIRKQIAQARAAAEEGQPTMSSDDAKRFKLMIAKVAGELEGTRLPPEAEGAARDAERDLRAMGESVQDEHIKQTLLEASSVLKDLIGEQVLES